MVPKADEAVTDLHVRVQDLGGQAPPQVNGADDGDGET